MKSNKRMNYLILLAIISVCFLFFPVPYVTKILHSPNEGLYALNDPEKMNLIKSKIHFIFYFFLFSPLLLFFIDSIKNQNQILIQIAFWILNVLIVAGLISMLVFLMSKSIKTIAWGVYALVPYSILLIYIWANYAYKFLSN